MMRRRWDYKFSIMNCFEQFYNMFITAIYLVQKEAIATKWKTKSEEEIPLEGSHTEGEVRSEFISLAWNKNSHCPLLSNLENETSLKLDDTDWDFLGENANLSDFNPDEVFSSSSDVVEGLNIAKDNENDNQNLHDEPMIDAFCSHASQSSSKNDAFP